MSKGTASKQSSDESIAPASAAGARSGKGKQMAEPSLNLDELRELANLVIEHGFTDFEFENENIRVRLSKSAAGAVVQQPAQTYVQSAPAAVQPQGQEQPQPAAEADPDAGLHKIVSPIVGTFYRSPGPD